MARVAYVHWNVKEADERGARLRALGFDVVRPRSADGAEVARWLLARPPAAVVLDLSRLPSHGREMARWLRERRATRHVPLVFVDGAPGKVAGVRALFPDAAYATWDDVGEALRQAMRAPPTEPVVPARPDYSTKPLAQRLGIREGMNVVLQSAPEGFERALSPLPPGATLRRDARRTCDMTIAFLRTPRDLVRRIEGLARRAEGGAVWIVFPKKAAGISGTPSAGDVRTAALGVGLVDSKVCAVDATWTALRFTPCRRP